MLSRIFPVTLIPRPTIPRTTDILQICRRGLLARAYLFYTGYYGEEPAEVTRAEALAAVEDVIASGEYGLVPQFKNLWPASSAKVAEKETMKL